MSKSMNARAQPQEPGTMWHNSGRPDRPQTVTTTPPTRIASTDNIPAPFPVASTTSRPGLRHRACRLFDGVITASSLASNEPVLDVRDFDWTGDLRRGWTAIRAEALAAPGAAAALWRNGGAVEAAALRYPRTLDALGAVPGLYDAAFALLPPGAHVSTRRGATKGLITCHLGLVVPRDGGARMRVRDRIVRWAEGETLVFDDSYEHEAWNDAASGRIILRLRVARPLRQPGRWIARHVLRLLDDRALPTG